MMILDNGLFFWATLYTYRAYIVISLQIYSTLFYGKEHANGATRR